MTLSTLSASAVRAGNFPVETERSNAEEHRRLLADAINELAAGFYTSQSTLLNQSAQDTISTTSWMDLSGLSNTVVASVPARLVASMVLEVEVEDDDAANGGSLDFRIVNGSTAISSEMTRRSRRYELMVPGQTGYEQLVVHATLDVNPATSYAIKGQAKGSTGNEVWKVRTASHLLLRLEPRSIR